MSEVPSFGAVPDRRYALGAMAVLLAGSLLSAIDATHPQNTLLQVGPVVLVALALPWMMRRWPWSKSSWNCLLIFLLLHLFAAHWTYSDVPYDRWLSAIGIDLGAILGSERNMFDRMVHFSFGLLVVRPIVEIETLYAKVDRRLAYRLAILFVLASSAAYEIFEWTVAIIASPENAEAYNGQQGDVFDAQKDMWMATAGAVLALMLLHRGYRRWRQE